MKTSTPVGCACTSAHVLHVKYAVAEVLIENARLNLVRCLGGLKSLLHCQDGLIGARSHIERIHQPQQSATDCHNRSDTHKVADAQARGAHGDNLAVCGQAAETEQDSHEHGHGNGDLECVGHREEKYLASRWPGGAIAHHHFKNVGKVAHEKNEGKDHAADKRVGENLAEDVTCQDAHRKALNSVYRAGHALKGSGLPAAER